ncbi:MAG: alginate export family protein, partial [Shewanella sp.]
LAVPESRFSYYTNDSVFSREGLRVADLRLAYDGQLGQSNIYAQAEIAKQTHDDFDMDARAGYLEMGYRFMDWRFSPTLSYRYSQFSGDDPATATFERWDPLFAGGGGDEWVQGLNQYKVVQTSNVIAHRFMGRLFISPQLELTPQFWLFQADELNNLGGAQALSQFASKELGQELNVTARYVVSANLIFVFSAAYTIPGEAIREALNDDYHHWLSASTLMIARF